MKAKEIGDLIDQVIAFEEGTMSADDMIPFFQGLIDSDLAWALQGTYGRQAKTLITAGFCTPKVES